MSALNLMISIAQRLHEDRVSLQEEVDRQRAENEKLRADLALEQSRIVLQRAEIERLRAEIEALHGALKRRDAEILEGKP